MNTKEYMCAQSMRNRSESRLVVRLSDSLVDRTFSDRLEVAAKTLGCSKSHLVRRAVEFALDHPERLRDLTS